MTELSISLRGEAAAEFSRALEREPAHRNARFALGQALGSVLIIGAVALGLSTAQLGIALLFLATGWFAARRSARIPTRSSPSTPSRSSRAWARR